MLLAWCVRGAASYATYRGSNELQGYFWFQLAEVAAIIVAAGALPPRA